MDCVPAVVITTFSGVEIWSTVAKCDGAIPKSTTFPVASNPAKLPLVAFVTLSILFATAVAIIVAKSAEFTLFDNPVSTKFFDAISAHDEHGPPKNMAVVMKNTQEVFSLISPPLK
jgi:hypothetical protein